MVDPERCIGCGECEAVCATHKGATTLRGQEITDWTRGEYTLPTRLADYTVGLMNGRWDTTVHVLHMYAITERCDCLNTRQQPMIDRDLGFLVGKNPFAMDLLAARVLTQALEAEGKTTTTNFVAAAQTCADHADKTYGILAETPVVEMLL